MKGSATLSGAAGKAYLEPGDVAMMEKTASNLRDRILIRLLFHLGCRVTEALGVKVEDIDFTRGTITIRHLKTRPELYCPGCGARLALSHAFCPRCGAQIGNVLAKQKEERRLRTLPADEETLGMLQEYVRRGGPVRREGGTYIFGINRHRVWQVVKDCAERAGLPRLVNPETGRLRNVSPHRLRDAFAVHAVKLDDSGDGLRLLQQHLGHASFNTTARYRKISGKEHREWYQGLWRTEADD